MLPRLNRVRTPGNVLCFQKFTQSLGRGRRRATIEQLSERMPDQRTHAEPPARTTENRRGDDKTPENFHQRLPSRSASGAERLLPAMTSATSRAAMWGIALLFLGSGGFSVTRADYPRRTPIVEAVQKT